MSVAKKLVPSWIRPTGATPPAHVANPVAKSVAPARGAEKLVYACAGRTPARSAPASRSSATARPAAAWESPAALPVPAAFHHLSSPSTLLRPCQARGEQSQHWVAQEVSVF